MARQGSTAIVRPSIRNSSGPGIAAHDHRDASRSDDASRKTGVHGRLDRNGKRLGVRVAARGVARGLHGQPADHRAQTAGRAEPRW